jgi:D-alanine-D-alanine ligase
VLLLLEEHSLVPGKAEFRRKRSDWRVGQCLESLGHRISLTEYTSVPNLLTAIEKTKPDVVFNLTDAANGDRRKDTHICALLELIGIPYTGAGPRGLMLARDKATSKVIARAAGFTVPKFVVIRSGPLRIPKKLPFPMVVKPRFGDASEGISGASLVTTGLRLADRVRYLWRRGCEDIICEEYISGREFFVGVVHDRIVRPREFVFQRESPGAPRLATSSFKFDLEYQRRWGIRAVFAKLNKSQIKELATLVHLTSVALEIRDYGRFDVILTPNNKWVFLEANPNPGLSPPKLNWAGTWDSVDYEKMIAGIIGRAISRAKSTKRSTLK